MIHTEFRWRKVLHLLLLSSALLAIVDGKTVTVTDAPVRSQQEIDNERMFVMMKRISRHLKHSEQRNDHLQAEIDKLREEITLLKENKKQACDATSSPTLAIGPTIHPGNSAWPTLKDAVENNDVAGVRGFLSVATKNDYEMNQRFGGSLLIELAASKGYTAVVAEFLRAGLAYTVFSAQNRQNAIHQASGNGYLDVVQLFLDNGVNVDIRDWEGMTPLHHAAKKGQVEVVRYLLDRGADRTIGNKNNYTPKDIAGSSKGKEIIQLLEASKISSRTGATSAPTKPN